MSSAAPYVVLLAFTGVVFQIWLKEALWRHYGIGVEIEPLENFPYTCRKIEHEPFQACEDMWLSEATRQLYLACSDTMGRHHWHPSMSALNATERSKKDSLVIINIDSPKGDSFKFRQLSTPDFTGTAGDGLFFPNGFDVREDAEGGSHIYVVNNRPSVDQVTGQILEDQSGGHNGTVEHFYLKDSKKGVNLKHIKTYADPLIVNPNRPATVGESGFLVTNDHGLARPGFSRSMSAIFATGTITFCSPDDGCKTAASDMNYPNGLIRHPHTGLVYVPSSSHGYIRVFEPQEDKTLKFVDQIFTSYGIDNLSVDGNGDIYAAAFPKSAGIPKANAAPGTHFPAVSVLKVYKDEEEWDTEKVLEDVNSHTLPAATTVVHDAKTGRIFLSSVISPFITVCERSQANQQSPKERRFF